MGDSRCDLAGFGRGGGGNTGTVRTACCGRASGGQVRSRSSQGVMGSTKYSCGEVHEEYPQARTRMAWCPNSAHYILVRAPVGGQGGRGFQQDRGKETGGETTGRLTDVNRPWSLPAHEMSMCGKPERSWRRRKKSPATR